MARTRHQHRYLSAMPLAGMALLLVGCGRPVQERVAAPAEAKPASVPAPVTAGKQRDLGTFQVTSREILVSDPCYPLGADGSTDLQGVVKQVRLGTWRAEEMSVALIPKDVRCAELRAYHETHKHTGPCNWTPVSFSVGVDSGQAGIFDRKHFGDSAAVPKNYKWRGPPIDSHNPWYSLCCDVTLHDLAGVMPNGTVASSGYGDGGYSCFVCKAGHEVLGIRVVFISKDDEEAQ